MPLRICGSAWAGIAFQCRETIRQDAEAFDDGLRQRSRELDGSSAMMRKDFSG